MSTAAVDELTAVAAPARFWDRGRRLGVALVLLGGVAAALFGSLAPSRTARFTLSENAEGAALSINGQLGAVIFGLVALAAGVVLLAGVAPRRTTALLGLGIVAFVLSFLCARK